VIISTLDRENQDTYLVDKSSVLCTLNVRQIEMKSAGFVSALNLTGHSTSDLTANQTKLLLQNRIRTLTTLSKSIDDIYKSTNDRFTFFRSYLAIDSNVQYVEQGNRTILFQS
jgi:hypothetical protein